MGEDEVFKRQSLTGDRKESLTGDRKESLTGDRKESLCGDVLLNKKIFKGVALRSFAP